MVVSLSHAKQHAVALCLKFAGHHQQLTFFSALRSYATAAEQVAVNRVTRPGQAAPVLLPFGVTPEAAVAAFKQYQRTACFNLHASNLLQGGQPHSLQPVFMPFWLFDATISTEATATLGRRVDKSAGRNSPLVWTRMAEWRSITQQTAVPHTDHAMQVYAAYDIRRDLAEAAKPRLLDLSAAQPLSRQQLEAQRYQDTIAAGAGSGGRSRSAASSSSSSSGSSGSSGAGVVLQVPLLRQAIAWQLCHRQLMHQQIRLAAEQLKAELAADDVRDLQVKLHYHSRAARLTYLPAYHLRYAHGEKYTPSRADIVPAEYDALVGGAAGGAAQPRVDAELHPSPLKSQAAAAAAVATVGLGVMPLTSFALGVDPGFIGVAGADAALLAVLAASGAGAIASQLPLIARNRHAAEQAEADRTFYKQYDTREAAHGAPPDEHTLWLWRDADWRKWERDEPWSWDPDKRRAQAEELFRQQAQRDVDRVAAARQQQEQTRKREEEEARDASKQQRYGRHRRSPGGAGSGSHHHEEAGMRSEHGQRHGAHRRRRDFLGYYKALGIDLEEAAGTAISAEFIKSHYKSAAMKLHPDKHVHADAATQQRTAERFRRLQVAYEVLRDADKRRAYDQGRLVH